MKLYLLYEYQDPYYGQPCIYGVFDSIAKIQKNHKEVFIEKNRDDPKNIIYENIFTKEIKTFKYIDEMILIKEIELNKNINFM